MKISGEEEARKTTDWPRLAAMVIVWGAVLGVAWWFFRYAIGIVLPFAIAFAVGSVVHPLAVRLGKRLKMPVKVCAAILLLLGLSLVVLILMLGTTRLLRELRGLLSLIESDDRAFWDKIEMWQHQLSDLTAHIPFLRRLREKENLASLWESANEMIMQALRDMVGEISTRIPTFVGNFVRRIPAFFICLIVTVVACFYFALDMERVRRAVGVFLSPPLREKLSHLRERAGEILRRYVRAYLLILIITFLELYIALSILGVEYALLIAFLTALIDILPVLGVGIVLVPWSIFCLFTRRFFLGFGLLITYVIMTVVREVVEPRIVSGSFGLHPLLTLFSMYAGYKLFGVWGMILAPAAVISVIGSTEGKEQADRGGNTETGKNKTDPA